MFNDEVTFDLPKNLSYLAVSNPTTRSEGGGGGESSSPSFVGNTSLKKSVGSKAVNNEGKFTASRHSLVRRNTCPEQQSPKRHSESSKQNRSSGILKCKSQQESLKVLYKSAGSMSRSFSSVGKMNKGSSNVVFDTVQIREYPRCVGDNPSVKAGPPMSLEWRHQRQEETNVDDYELEKNERPIHEEGVRRVNGVERVELLTFEFKANLDDIKKSCEETEIIRQQRMETLNQTKRQERLEEFVEATKKNLKKVSLKRVLSSGKMRQSSKRRAYNDTDG